MFTEEILQMLFEEIPALEGEDDTYDGWVATTGYNESWTDQQIYAALPSYMLGYLGDFGLNASWMHGGM